MNNQTIQINPNSKTSLIICNANDCEVVATLMDGISPVTLYFNNDCLSFDGKDTMTEK